MKEALFDRVARFYDYETQAFTRDIPLYNDVPFYVEYAGECKGEVLELACGTGRVLIPIAAHGIPITGLDASAEMLLIAEKKKKTSPDEIARQITLVQGDMKKFDLKRTYRLIIVAFRSFQCLLTKADQRACLTCINKHLDQDGVLLLDLFAPRHDLLAQRTRSLYLGKFYYEEEGVHVTRRAEDTYDLAAQTLHEDRFYEWTDKQGTFHREVWSFDLAYLFRNEAELLLEACGFSVEDVFGDFKKNPYDYFSGEQIFVARKT
ncbi:MAG: class I SAM-dependent methyltransferase [candidate division WOR-3 bacterium]|nr:MAG: class I SAM-dependent methyltransferase [candidate division WOR-3 bacterium]